MTIILKLKIISLNLIKNSLQYLYDTKKYDKIIDKLKIEKKEIILNEDDKYCKLFFIRFNDIIFNFNIIVITYSY